MWNEENGNKEGENEQEVPRHGFQMYRYLQYSVRKECKMADLMYCEYFTFLWMFLTVII